MQIELKRIQQEVGLTFIHVTHDQEEAMTMADTIAVMNAGRIEQLGDPATLYERPASTFVANFLGQSNLLKATVTGPARDGEVPVTAYDTALTVAADHLPERRQGDLARGAPGEAAASASTAARNRLRGTVTDVSFTGVATQYLVRMPWGQRAHRRPAERRLRPRPALARTSPSRGRPSTGSRSTPPRRPTPASRRRASGRGRRRHRHGRTGPASRSAGDAGSPTPCSPRGCCGCSSSSSCR